MELSVNHQKFQVDHSWPGLQRHFVNNEKITSLQKRVDLVERDLSRNNHSEKEAAISLVPGFDGAVSGVRRRSSET